MRAVVALQPLCNVKAINFISPLIIVELEVDGTVYAPQSLPGIVGGRPVLYHHSASDYWVTQLPLALERTISPNSAQGLEDDTSYLTKDDGRLCPGVRLSSSPLTNIGGYAEALLGTTSGALLRKDAMERLTVSDQGFPTNEVYHPNIGGRLIGEIVDRKPSLNLARQVFTPFNVYIKH